MASSTRAWSKPLELPRRVTAAWLLFSASFVLAAGIHIKSAELAPTESGYALDAVYDIALTPTLEETLTRGIALYFVTEFEVVYPRWWTLYLWNRTVSEFSTQQRLSFNSLTRQYRVAFGGLQQNFDTLEEALAVIGRVRYAPAVRYPEVNRGEVYIAGLRLRLDTSQLPKPLQINALGSRDWNVSSDWYRWTFKP
jgi:hypothetical protein